MMNDYEDPSKLDERANYFDLAENSHRTNIDQDDDNPENCDPNSNWHFVGPERQDRDHSLVRQISERLRMATMYPLGARSRW